MKAAIGIVVSGFLAGCGFSAEPAPTVSMTPAPTTQSQDDPAPPADAPPPMPKNLQDALTARPMGVAVVPDLDRIQVTIAWNGQPGVQADLISKSGRSGARVNTQGAFAMNLVELEIADVVISADRVPPNGLHLADVHAILTSNDFTTTWTQDQDQADFTGDASLRVDWKVVTDKGPEALRPIEANGIKIGGHVRGNGSGPISASLTGSADGEFLAWGDLLQLSDLSFELHFSPSN